jgi:hypothetical protein
VLRKVAARRGEVLAPRSDSPRRSFMRLPVASSTRPASPLRGGIPIGDGGRAHESERQRAGRGQPNVERTQS